MVQLDARVMDVPVRMPRSRSPARTTVVAMAALAAVVFAVWLRAWLLAHDPVTGGEAVVGLMADAILRGQFSALHWGQSYGGAEPYVVAALFALFGHSAYVLDLTASILSALAAGLVFLLGRQVTGRPGPALVAAALAWVWPWAAVTQSTMELGFRQVTLVCGLGALVAAHRAAYGPARPGAHRAGASAEATTGGWPVWLVLGLVAGTGWWSSPEIVYFALAALGLAVAGLLRTRGALSRIERVLVTMVGFVVGALPWLAHNVSDHFDSLHGAGLGPAPHGSYAERLHVFFSHTGPILLGLRQPLSGAWTLSRPFGVTASVVVAVVAVGGGVVLWVHGRPGAWAILLYVVTFPFIDAALAPTSFWLDGRYGIYLPPVLALAVVGGVGVELRRPIFRWSVTALGVGALVLAGLATLYGFDAAHPPAGRSDSLSADPDGGARRIAQDLVADALLQVVAGGSSAYVLDFLNPALTATPARHGRDRQDEQTVLESSDVAWLFVGPTAADRARADAAWGTAAQPLTLSATAFETTLAAQHVACRVVLVGFMVAVVPEGVTGEQVVQLGH